MHGFYYLLLLMSFRITQKSTTITYLKIIGENFFFIHFQQLRRASHSNVVQNLTYVALFSPKLNTIYSDNLERELRVMCVRHNSASYQKYMQSEERKIVGIFKHTWMW